MADTFAAQMKRLQEQVGTGDLEGSITVDQVYAKYQHEVLDLKHPHGGEAKYLTKPLQEKYQRYLDGLADDVLKGRLKQGMVEVVEDLVGEVGRRAPVEEGTLRGSGSPSVYDNGMLYFHKPPLEPRKEDTDE